MRAHTVSDLSWPHFVRVSLIAVTAKSLFIIFSILLHFVLFTNKRCWGIVTQKNSNSQHHFNVQIQVEEASLCGNVLLLSVKRSRMSRRNYDSFKLSDSSFFFRNFSLHRSIDLRILEAFSIFALYWSSKLSFRNAFRSVFSTLPIPLFRFPLSFPFFLHDSIVYSPLLALCTWLFSLRSSYHLVVWLCILMLIINRSYHFFAWYFRNVIRLPFSCLPPLFSWILAIFL